MEKSEKKRFLDVPLPTADYARNDIFCHPKRRAQPEVEGSRSPIGLRKTGFFTGVLRNSSETSSNKVRKPSGKALGQNDRGYARNDNRGQDNKGHSSRLWLSLITFIFCAVLVFCAFFVPFKGYKTASAATAATVDELTINNSGTATNGFVFKQENLDTLYTKILNKASGTATLAELKTALAGTVGDVAGACDNSHPVNKMINSDEINGGALLKVKFGGLEWQVVSVTRSNSDDVIATLWLTDNNASISNGSFANGSYYTDSFQDYMTVIYGTSYVRVVTLNAGGKYVTVNSSGVGSLSSQFNPQNNNSFANFTVASKVGSLTKYIVKPADVKYQSQETWAGTEDTAAPYNCLNDAYGTPYVENWRCESGYRSKTNYATWQDDYIWLPSITETGGYKNYTGYTVASNGIWKTTAATRARNNAYLRSIANGSITGSSHIYINANGAFDMNHPNYPTAAIRPALHLNLTKAQDDAAAIISTQPNKSTDLTYNGAEQTYTPTNFDSTTMEITGNKATNADSYTCTVTPKSGYAWAGYSTDPVTINFKINKAEPNVTCTFTDATLEDKTKFYLKDFSTLPAITNSHANATEGSIDWDTGQTPSKTKSEYSWTFTPNDTVNYNTVTGTKTLTFADAIAKKANVYVKEGAEIYDRYDTATYSSLSEYLKTCLTVKVEYDDGSEGSPLADSSYNVTTTNISVTAGDSQSKTISVRVTSTDTAINGLTGSVSATVIKAVIESISVEAKDGAKELTYPVTLDDIKDNYDVYLGWSFSARELKADADKITVTLDGGGELRAGTLPFTFTFTDGDLTKTSDPIDVVIAKGIYDVSGITFVGDNTPIYDGNKHSIAYGGTLPAGVGVEYEYNGVKQSTPFEFTDADSYEITLSFTQEDSANYAAITETIKATLTINKADYPDADKITFEDKNVSFGGEYSLVAENVPEGVTVTYVYNGTEQAEPFVFTEINEAGYKITARFTHTNANYNDIGDKTKTLIITGKMIYGKADLGVSGEGVTVEGKKLTATYSGEAIVITPTGSVKDMNGAEVTSAYTTAVTVMQGEKEVFEIVGVGSYDVTVTYTMPAEGAYANYELEFELRYTLTVNAADFDMGGIELADGSFTYDGEEHSLQIEGELPEWITVTYEGNGQSQVGSYTVTVKFSHENSGYNEIADITAQLEITKRKVTISIDPVSSVAGEELVEITATVIDGSIVEGETPYRLVCTPDKDIVGEYPVTFEYEDGYGDKYEITCENGVYIVSNKTQDEGGNGGIDLPIDISVAFKVTQSETSGDYSVLDGIKRGYWAQLWYRNEDGTLGEEFTDEINCILTLSIPNDIIVAIRGGEEINREKIMEELKLYYVSDGDLTRIKNFKIAQKEDESWQVSFNYNEKFRAEIVFNAPGLEEPSAPESNFLKEYWMYIVIGVVAVLLVIILIVVISIKKAHADDYDDYDYDDDDDDEDDDDDDDY